MIRREPTFRRPTYASRRLMILRRARFPYGHVRLAIQPGCRAPTGLLVTLEVGGDVVGHPGRAVLIGGVEGVPAERRAGGRRDAVDLRPFGRGGRRGGRPCHNGHRSGGEYGRSYNPVHGSVVIAALSGTASIGTAGLMDALNKADLSHALRTGRPASRVFDVRLAGLGS